MEQEAQVRREPEPNAALAVPIHQGRGRGVGDRLVTRKFFEISPMMVAPRILGKLLVAESGSGTMAGRIVEAEAYLGPHCDPPDPAAHTFRGPTPRNQVLFGPPGHAYVYSIYGKYFCLNISCEVEGQAGCVLLRALEPVAGFDQMTENRGLRPDRGLTPDSERGHSFLRHLTSGPSRLCQALGVARASHNGLDVTDTASPLQIRDDGFRVTKTMVTPRIGINPANHAVDWPMRFVLPGNACVSGRKSLAGKEVAIP